MPYHPMDNDEVRAFLTALPARTGKLATVRADGRPHVAPVWYDVDDDGTLVFQTGVGTVKGQNLAREGRASLCVDDDRPPFSFVVVEGAVFERGRLTRCAKAGPGGSAGATWERTGPRSTGPATGCPESCWCGCGRTGCSQLRIWPTEVAPPTAEQRSR